MDVDVDVDVDVGQPIAQKIKMREDLESYPWSADGF